MNLMKRVGLAVVFLVVGVLCAASPVLAGWGPRNMKSQSPVNYGTIQLTNTGDEPAASGEATLRNVRCSVYVNYLGGYPTVVCVYEGKLIVKCQNLIPGATYWTPAGTFTADSKGAEGITGEVGSFDFPPVEVEVVRLDEDGSSTTVLWGYFD